ncbi:unnamed protein product [Enterobius vermicularis]|uniref:Uncharacterized protein n=1 Tax=Enterobius vermicularis TaxID=51028 RepID=A0A0N4UZR4_ENTVE|nr:unnamed protein product [Enterobius vermicularis]
MMVNRQESIESEKIDLVEFIRTTPKREITSADSSEMANADQKKADASETSSNQSTNDGSRPYSPLNSLIKANADIRPFKKTSSTSKLKTKKLASMKFHSLDLNNDVEASEGIKNATHSGDIIQLPVIEGLQLDDNEKNKSRESLKSSSKCAEAHLLKDGN